jgi:hypothetical protein
VGQRQAPASYGQRLLWFLQRLVGNSGALNCPMVVRVRGPLEEAALRRALDRLTARHESLRTTFTGAGHRLTQRVNDPAPVQFEVVDLQGQHIDEVLLAELATTIDHTVAPIRTRVWQLGTNEHVLCLNMHHLVTDAWSCGVLYRELGALLEESPDLPDVDWQYIDFSNWQHEFMHNSQAHRHRDYWTRKLAGMELPAVPLGPRVRPRTTGLVQADVSPATTEALKRIARAERSTLFAVMLAAYYATLHLKTGQRDLAVSSLFANRSQRPSAGTIGFLANMVVLRATLPAQASFADVVQSAARTAREAFIHECLPYQLLPVPAATVADQRVEDVMFQMLGEPIKVSTRAAGVELEGVVPRGVARFDCELAVVPHEAGLQVSLFHATSRLAPEWARSLVDDYVALVTAAAADPSRPLAALAGHTFAR